MTIVMQELDAMRHHGMVILQVGIGLAKNAILKFGRVLEKRLLKGVQHAVDIKNT